MLIEQEAQHRKEAKARFVGALWAQKGSEELISQMKEAGLTVTAANELEAKVEEARRQIDHANQLPRLRKDARAARGHSNKVQARVAAETERLEAEAREAGYAADDATKAPGEAERDAQKLLLLHDEGLVPATRLPEEIAFLARRRQAEEAVSKAYEVRATATHERDRCGIIADRMEGQLANLPITKMAPLDRNRLEKAVKAAKKDLHEAEERLKVAEGAVEAARNAVPKAR
jgi:hypothetical protein